MIYLDILKARGVSTAAWKPKFEKEGPSPGIKKLLDLMQTRIVNGRTTCFSNWKTFWAIDQAYNAAFYQTTAVLLQNLMNRSCTGAQAYALCNQWGISTNDLFTPVMTPGVNGAPDTQAVDANGAPAFKIRQKAFFKVLVPIMKSYVTIRRAKLFNDRNLSPFFKYEPIEYTDEKRVLCEVVTDIVQRLATTFGLPNYLSQCILMMCLYGQALMFVKEPWYKEKQCAPDQDYVVRKGDTRMKIADQFNVPLKSLNAANPEAKGRLKIGEVLRIPERETTVKEGLRYDTPHPTRTFFDMTQPTNTINTDTGMAYAGYWKVERYGDLMDRTDIWNKDRISFGNTDWFGWGNGALNAFWSDVYPCRMTFPADVAFTGTGGGPLGPNQRSWTNYYLSTDVDAPVFITSLFMKVVPKEYDLGDYPYPVWCQFIVANDYSVLWAAPVPYTPVLYMGYDPDMNAYPQPSMGLEILPFQIQLGNILSQILFTAKQALMKVVPYDTNQVDRDTITKLQNYGEDFVGLLFLPFDSLKAKVAQTDTRRMFETIDLAAKSSAEMTAQIPIIIDVLERLLGMSAAEVGATATHEQTAQEIRVVATNTTVRVEFTGNSVDDFVKAWKLQLYQASMAYLDDEFEAQVNPTEEAVAAMKRLGFDVPDDVTLSMPGDRNSKITVRVKKSQMVLEAFASDRDGANRINDPAVAAVILQGVQAVVQNSQLAASVGSPAILKMLSQAMRLAGAPKDFELKVDAKASAEMQAAQLQQQVQGMMDQILGEVAKGIKPLGDAIKQGQQELEKVAQVTAQLTQEVQRLSQQQEQQAKMTAQAIGQVKQEADETAKSVLEIAGILHQQAPPAPQVAPETMTGAPMAMVDPNAAPPGLVG